MEYIILPGYKLNPNEKVVAAITKRCEKIGGICPCVHDEWDENTPEEDQMCPCVTYRNGGGCHCQLYLEE